MSLSKDIERLRSDTKLSLGELSEFAQRLRGKSVPEALGTIAQSQLGRALIEASAVFALVLVLGTVPFYFVRGSGDAASPTSQAAAAQSASSEDTNVAKEGENSAGNSKLPATVEEAEKKLGIDTKPPSLDSKVNPLESKADDLLKDLK